MHCRIMRKTDNEGKMVVVLEDTSSNGTYHNGEKVMLDLTRFWSLIMCFQHYIDRYV
jgi:nitrate reductase NapAB chaperone NapD